MSAVAPIHTRRDRAAKCLDRYLEAIRYVDLMLKLFREYWPLLILLAYFIAGLIAGLTNNP